MNGTVIAEDATGVELWKLLDQDMGSWDEFKLTYERFMQKYQKKIVNITQYQKTKRLAQGEGKQGMKRPLPSNIPQRRSTRRNKDKQEKEEEEGKEEEEEGVASVGSMGVEKEEEREVEEDGTNGGE